MRIAATADLHAKVGDADRIAAMFAEVREHADVLVLAGDLTDHGSPSELESLVNGLRGIDIPIVAVLGNHDHEGGMELDMLRILGGAGIHILDRRRPTTVIDGVGFAGVKGFGGGFGTRMVRGFGEDSVKAFVAASLREAEALRQGLSTLEARDKVAVLHYSPIQETVESEPCDIWPFLGSGRLEQALDEGGARLAVHGHAHHGRRFGKTERGVPVHNVSLPVLREAGEKQAWTLLHV